ncbi:PilZ domain-containing protein [Oceanicoccus sp. KOV_DT_Chl]|uniref:PilZ domain-containing protein n=1 Tax=Oceanicoccus sp. KOV_DT_Chl TaxID=1904639 RepID=UPI000C7C5A7B|nr:PilZ domain-containing protein [Oceanicoccus sp. KOV_DT_Chl]
MTDPNEERRVFSRITFDCSITLSQGEKRWPAKLIDLSLKGLLVEKPQNWDADITQLVDAHITLDEDAFINMSINWRHDVAGQIGFECEHIDIDSIIHLRRLVELNLGDADLLDRELASLGR